MLEVILIVLLVLALFGGLGTFGASYPLGWSPVGLVLLVLLLVILL